MFEKLFSGKKDENLEGMEGFKGKNGIWYKAGSKVFVERSPDSGGKIESGWRIIRIDTDKGEVFVAAGEGENIIRKKASIAKLKETQDIVHSITTPGTTVSLDRPELKEDERDGWKFYGFDEDEHVVLERMGLDGANHVITMSIDDYLK